MANDLHKDHRKRVREEFLEYGFNDGTPPHKIIEMLLFYSIPRKDTNEIAHKLINEFGSITNVLDAEPHELMKIKGVSYNTAALIKLTNTIARRYRIDKQQTKRRFNDISEVYSLLVSKYFALKNEVVMLTTLNGKGEIIATDKLAEGDITSVNISTRSIIECIVKRKAIYAVLSHNHPNSTALPSREDIAVTKSINDILKRIGVRLIDHIIVSDDDYISMAQTGSLSSIFEDDADISI